MNGLRQPLLALAIVVSLAPPSLAQSWVSRGPYCRATTDLAAAGQAAGPAYLAVGGRLFRSSDAWRSWSAVAVGPPSSWAPAVAVAPQDPQLVYVALWDGDGVFRSADGGATWKRVSTPLPDQLVEGLLVPTGKVGTVYAVAGYTGVFRSRDRGETWKDITPPEIRPGNFFHLASHRMHPERLALVTSRELWRSEDGGEHWRRWSTGLPAGDPRGLGALSWSPQDPEVAFITRGHTVYRSDRGGRWQRVAELPVSFLAPPISVLAGPGKVPLLWAGVEASTARDGSVLRSRDGGKTWQTLALAGEVVYELRWFPELSRLVALTFRGAFYSDDQGASWKRTGSGVAAATTVSLAVGGGNRRTLVAGIERCPGGVGRSADGAVTWEIRETRAPAVHVGSDTTLYGLVAAPSKPGRLYAGATDEVLRSDDGGKTWTHSAFNDGLSGGVTRALAVSPLDPDLLFAGGGHGLTRSRDGGRTWTAGLLPYPLARIEALAWEARHPQRLLAAGDQGGVARSDDGGETWAVAAGTVDLPLRSLAISPVDAQLVLAASSSVEQGPVLRSVDGGLTWQAAANGVTGWIAAVAFSRDASEAMAVGERGVFRSRDGGLTWAALTGAPSGGRALVQDIAGIWHVATPEGVASLASP